MEKQAKCAIPDPEESLAYQREQAKAAEVRQQREALQTEIAEARASVSTVEDAARRLLAGEPEALPYDFRAAERRLAVLDRAIQLAEKAANGERAAAASIARQKVLSVHRAMGQEIKRAVLALRTALEAEQALRDELDRLRIDFALPLQPVTFWAAGKDRCAPIVQWLAELDAAYLDAGS